MELNCHIYVSFAFGFGEVVWVRFKAVPLTNEWAVTKVILKRTFGTGRAP